jgi:hypothetical protein
VEAYGDRGMARAYYAPMLSTVITLDRPGGTPRIRRKYYPAAILREKLFGWQSTVVRAFVEEFQDFVAVAEGRGQNAIIARGEDGLRICEIVRDVYQGAHAEP